MLEQFGHYVVRQPLGESLHSKVYLVEATDGEVGRSSVLRAIKPKYQSPALIEALGLQIEQLKSLHLPNTLVPSLLQTKSGQSFLVRPHVLGTPLSQLSFGPQRIKEILKLVREIALRLQQCHDAGHIHKALKPHNILVDPQGAVQLIDDVHVLDMNELSYFIYDQEYCRHTLPYISPEQTGRIRISVDYTSDIYSLGIIFYELLAGSPPFLSKDPLALIHSHLAEEPTPLSEHGVQVPEMLSLLIEQLLQKPREKRYQTARGVAHDLEQCLFLLETTGDIAAFNPRTQDYSNRITIPSLMVGRNVQKNKLLEEFTNVCQGQFRSAFVSGFSGIGKTRLIQELQLPIVAARGYYASGKFDQYQRHIPYSTLIQALRGLMRVFLTEDSQRLVHSKERLEIALGNSGQLITSIIPELELIIGRQPALTSLPPIEARNRFRDVIGNFITALATAEHPLTLFIDDLQWCDNATFEVIEMLLANSAEYQHLFFIGAYRHNEVDENHRLARILRKLDTASQPYLALHLETLTQTNVNEMTAYILNTWPSKTRQLSQVIYKTSDGNPLFVNESIRWLHTFGHLHPGADGTWSWDDEQVRHSKIPGTALELFRDKILRLPERAKQLVLLSACLGARFEASVLAACGNVSLPQLYSDLAEALTHNLLRLDKGSIYFFHDQVQAAAESLIESSVSRDMHATIACTLIAQVPKQQRLSELDNLFSIVEHLAKGRVEATTVEERTLEANYNYHAGIRAMNSLAMENAYHFFDEARQLLAKVSWSDEYDRLYSIHKHLARTAMAIGNQPRSEALLDTLLERATNDIDKADCLYEQTAGLSSMGIFGTAIDRGNQGLDFFSRRIPDDDNIALARSAEILETIRSRFDDPWQHILDITPTADRATQIETAIYSELIPDYYLAGMVPQLYLSAIQSTENCLAGGVDESVIYGFSMVGLYLQRQDLYEQSFRYEDLGIALAERYENTFGATKGINGILWTNMHNRSEGKHIIEQCWQNIQRGKNCGDLYNSGLSYGPLIWNMVTRGAALSDIEQVAEECVSFSNKFNLSLSLGLARSALFGWCDELSDSRDVLPKEEIAQYLETWESAKHVVSIGGYHSLRGIALHFKGQYEDSHKSLMAAEPYLRGLSDNILNRLWYVFRFLNALSLGAGSDDPTVSHCLERVETWAALGPILKPYLQLMRAELALSRGEQRNARNLYHDVIFDAHKAEYTLLEAHANARLARLSETTGAPGESTQRASADSLFKACGTTLLITKTEVEEEEEGPDSPSLSRADAVYLFRASRAISSELDTEKVQSIIMSTLMERAGATDGALLVEEGGQLRLAVLGAKNEGNVTVKHTSDATSPPPISMAIARYVFRSGQGLRLADASADLRFTHDQAIAQHSILSVICHPIEHHGRVIGLLYLHNTVLTGAFELTALDFVRLLATQGAISLQNAQLYQELQQGRKELTHILKQTTARESLLARAENLGGIGSWKASKKSGKLQLSRNLRHVLLVPDDCALHKLDELVQLIHIEDRPAFLETATGSNDQNENSSIEVRLGENEEDPRIVEVSAKLSSDNEFVVGIVHDVTEIRRHQSRLRQAQRMEAIGQLAAGVAHDLNNMLQPILGYSELLLRRTSSGPMQRDLEEIRRSSKRAADVVRQLLVFSRKRSLVPEVVDFTVVLRGLERMLRSLIREDIRIVLDTSPDILALCDASQLEQIVVNLAVNARDAMKQGGTLTITTSWRCLPEAGSDIDLPPGTYASLRVQDTGHGMSSSTVAHIFEPFFTTKAEAHGTGLGLATVFGIVHQHHGEIFVHSTVGEGTEFEVLFPQSDAEVAISEDVTPIEANTSAHVLVVEDDEMVRRSIIRLLEDTGYSVTEAASGSLAEDRLALTTNPIDLLVTDLIMPGGTGVSLYQKLIEQQPELPVIFISGHPYDTMPSLTEPYVAFLAKPFTSSDLIGSIQKVLASRSQ